MARTTTPDQKAKKQKIILAVGGVILLGLLAFQLPKLMKGSSSPTATPAATTTSVDSTGAATPTAVAATPASSSVPLSSELTFAPSVGKVASVSLFHGKDPFKPRVPLAELNGSATPPATTPPTQAVPPATPTGAATGAATGPLFGTVEGSTPPAATTPAGAKGAASKGSSLPTATIMFNGKKLKLKLGEAFPKSQPVFRLAGIQSGNVLVALVKGGLADGSAVITLPTRHPVTLVNTVDKTRYTLVLLKGKKGA